MVATPIGVNDIISMLFVSPPVGDVDEEGMEEAGEMLGMGLGPPDPAVVLFVALTVFGLLLAALLLGASACGCSAGT